MQIYEQTEEWNGKKFNRGNKDSSCRLVQEYWKRKKDGLYRGYEDG